MKWFDATQEELVHYQELRTDQEAMMAAQIPTKGPRGGTRKENKPSQPVSEQTEQIPSRPGERVASMI
jgi:hypothetical protein